MQPCAAQPGARVPGLLPLVLLLLVAPWAQAQDRFSVPGGHGFNWSKPKSARCVRLGEADVKQLKPCEFHATGAFGLPLAYYTCPRAKGGETLVFRNAAECKEALETMQANAP